MKRVITLRVNGECYEVAVEPRRTLLEVLRRVLRDRERSRQAEG